MVTQDLTTPLAPPTVGERLRSVFHLLKNAVKHPFYLLYEKRLEGHVAEWVLPHHIGIIMDGNRRFARGLGLSSVSDGHRHGAQKLWEVLNWSYQAGVKTVTVWCFSIDNFERDTQEVQALLELFEEKTLELAEHDEVHARQVRLRYIGELSRLPESLQGAIKAAEKATENYTAYGLNIAMAYGGREELTSAFRRYLEGEGEKGSTPAEMARDFQAEMIEPFLYTSGQPEPDLIIRTSGEVRMSGFLLWQSAYSEYYFCDTHWPAFRKIDFIRALRSYNERHRRFGR
jgi:short-chain Z-isoprenyl diphosphate synthase